MAKVKKRPKFKHNRSLPTLRMLPVGVVEKPGRFNYRTAKSKEQIFYYCNRCRGWIEGRPYHKFVTDERIGMSFICLRCGKEIDFHGKDNPHSPKAVLQ